MNRDKANIKKLVRDSLQQGIPGLKPKGMICDLCNLVANTTSSVEIISYLHYDNGTQGAGHLTGAGLSVMHKSANPLSAYRDKSTDF